MAYLAYSVHLFLARFLCLYPTLISLQRERYDPESMKILAADTSTSIITVGLCDGERVLAETVVACGRSHSERLIETLNWVLNEAGAALAELDALAITIGPGSFTGLRIGAATWKGLAFAAKLPLVPVPTLDAMTRLAPFHDGLVCPLLDARMGEVFGALYRFERGRREKLQSDRVCLVEKLLDGVESQVVFLGDGAALYRERILRCVPQAIFVPERNAVPRATAVAAEALALLHQGIPTDPASVAPVYLRKSQAEEARASAMDKAGA